MDFVAEELVQVWKDGCRMQMTCGLAVGRNVAMGYHHTEMRTVEPKGKYKHILF
jgi:hypothetical protein